MKTLNIQTLTLGAAAAAVEAAQAKAAALGMAIATTVVDHSGVVKLYSRMDGAPLVAGDASYKKARTAVGFGMPTGKPWHDFIKDDPILSGGAPALEDFILLGGGSSIYVDGALVGAIGVAGGHYSKDEACVQSALDALEQLG